MTTYYVDPAAGGANNGTSWTNAWTTIQTAFDTAVAGDIVYCRGTETLAAKIDVDTNTGAYNTGMIKFIGCNASGTVDGTRYVLDANGGSFHVVQSTTPAMIWLENIEAKNTAAGEYHGFNLGSSAACSGWVFINCCANNCGGNGFFGDWLRYSHFVRCVAYSNTSSGFAMNDIANKFLFCCARDNTAIGFYVSGAYICDFIGCVAHGNGDDGFYAYIGSIFNCVCDGNTDDGILLRAPTSSVFPSIVGNRITNQSGSGDIGLNLQNAHCLTGWNYFEDNDGDNIQNATYHNPIPFEGGSTTSNLEDLANTNEGYVDKTNHDFSTNYVDSGDPDQRRTGITIPWS